MAAFAAKNTKKKSIFGYCTFHQIQPKYRGLESNIEKNKYFSSRYIRSAHYKDLLETAKKKTAKTFAMPKLSASKL